MRNAVLAILVGFLLLGVLFTTMTGALVTAGVSAYVVQAKGGVDVQRSGSHAWRPVTQSGARVKVGDQVRTALDGTVTLKYADGTTLKVGPNSRMTVRKYLFDSGKHAQVSLFRLDLGKVWTRVAHELAGDSRFEIETPTTVAAVHGTIFSVEATADATAVEVESGAVEVQAGSRKETLNASSVGRVTATGLETAAWDDTQRAAWEGQDILLPSIRLARVLPGNIKPDGSCVLKGEAEPGAKVAIAGQTAEVDANGEFTVPVTLHKGENKLPVTVTDAAGHASETEQTVTW
ncbi:MAG: FecR domain-containing protein [Armatimonadetes bacterium]|nr:FecR domain-containing protein [Armatimonadota bacterium]